MTPRRWLPSYGHVIPTSCSCRRPPGSAGGAPSWPSSPASAGCSTSREAVRRAEWRCSRTSASTSPTFARACSPSTGGCTSEGVAAAVVARSGERLLVASTHLGLKPEERAEHAGEVVTLLRQVPAPHAVVAGDFNEPPGKPAWRAFQAGGLRDLGPESGVTFPARGPAQAHRRDPRLDRRRGRGVPRGRRSRWSSGPATTGPSSRCCRCPARQDRRGARRRGSRARARGRAARGTARCR